jgi:hypothetical protein
MLHPLDRHFFGQTCSHFRHLVTYLFYLTEEEREGWSRVLTPDYQLARSKLLASDSSECSVMMDRLVVGGPFDILQNSPYILALLGRGAWPTSAAIENFSTVVTSSPEWTLPKGIDAALECLYSRIPTRDIDVTNPTIAPPSHLHASIRRGYWQWALQLLRLGGSTDCCGPAAYHDATTNLLDTLAGGTVTRPSLAPLLVSLLATPTTRSVDLLRRPNCIDAAVHVILSLRDPFLMEQLLQNYASISMKACLECLTVVAREMSTGKWHFMSTVYWAIITPFLEEMHGSLPR